MMQKYKGQDAITNQIVFEVDTINKCNFNCTYCTKQNNLWNPTKDDTEWGERGDILKLVNFFKTFPYPKIVHLLGGEPTLHSDLPEFIKQIDSDVKLFTNGSNYKVLKVLSELPRPPAVTISIHLAEFKMEMLQKIIDGGIVSKFRYVTFLIILNELDKNFNQIDELLKIISQNNFGYDYHFPFDESGFYKFNDEQERLYYILQEKYPQKFVTLGQDSKLDHLEVWKRRDTISQKKKCGKNLWSIDYNGNFEIDGGSYKFNFNQVSEMVNNNDFSKFKFLIRDCNSACWCPVNNYYPKIRLN